MFEAQQAHYYGLNPALALASVTSTPAKAAGMDHRVGTIAEGLLLVIFIIINASYSQRYRI
jgi:imidazolonepropionase-like amidohydrolase